MVRYSEIKNKWQSFSPDGWWGDNLDVRFVLCEKLLTLKNKTVLDVGCGAGIILSEINNSNAKIGFDINESQVRITKLLDPNILAYVGNMYSIPHKEASFDIVILSNILEIANQKEELLKGISTLLKDKGIMFFTTPNGNHKKYRGGNKIGYETIVQLLNKEYDFDIFYFNPFPEYLPKRALANIPLTWTILKKLMKYPIFKDSCKYYFCVCKKKKL